ncbi:uncharacterized protein LOC132259940 [Phlebotomus argentipes]|uniref:uncharacterized protein LOC132259940 n=1 Tax=Phlebotomus argentipes TaxID=94469 RepID=UPI002892A815|nr:uncharacterized protein LOC132259940 [Phlebotomus argentipes]
MSVSIKSFVFLDTEGTGLPQFNGSTKIVEISLVACSVDHFVASSDQAETRLPRVQHKLTLCVNPFKRICDESTKITGLDNYDVEHESKFGIRELEMIKSFVERLQQPVCLVAHNGYEYDYPLLRKEFMKHKVAVPDGLLCADSLEIFRKIDAARDRERLEEEELAEFIENELKEMEKVAEAEERTTQLSGCLRIHKEPADGESPYEIICNLDISVMQKKNETTPKRAGVASSPPRMIRQRQARSSQGTSRDAREDEVPRARKQLFPQKRKYRLCDIYARFFGANPEDAHGAESDCYILMKCALKEARDFLATAQVHSRPFEEISIEKCIF